jgi:glucan phosphorylase
MKKLLSLLVLAVCATAAMAQGAPPQGGVDQPYTMEYYYKTQWGHQQEFLQLFLKNHYPLLRRIQDTGRILALKIETPANHMTEESRWDYRVTVTYKNSTVATTENPEEETIIHQLYPDQERYTREEQHRFEILLSHWDLPVTDITPGTRK